MERHNYLILSPTANPEGPLLKGLTIIDTRCDEVILDWYVYPDVVRATCLLPDHSKWLGCTFNSQDNSGCEMWMICDMADPIIVLLNEFPNSRITRMIAYPYGADLIRLVGIDSQNEDLFVYDTPANASPVSEFEPVPPAGDAPLSVDFMNCSYDCDGEIVEIQADWDNDGTVDEYIQGSPSYVTHTFNETGLHELVLTVIDDCGASSQWTGTVDVL